MRRRLRNGLFIGGGVLIAAITAAAIPFLSSIRANPPTGPPTTFATLAVADADGTVRALGTVAPAGRPTVITFWASWCAPCLLETKALVTARARYPATDLGIVAINVDATPRDRAALTTFLDRSGGRALTQVLGTGQTYATITGHRMLALPRGYVFDRVGEPFSTLAGYEPGKSDAKLADILKSALRR